MAEFGDDDAPEVDRPEGRNEKASEPQLDIDPSTAERQTYPLNHGLGYMPFPRDATRFGPLIKDVNAFRMYALLYSRASPIACWERGSHGDVYLEKGQCIGGVRETGDALGLTKNTSHRILKKLEKLGLIARKAGQRGSVISLVCYGVYGDAWRGNGTAMGTAPGTEAGQLLGQHLTPKERKNVKNERTEEHLSAVADTESFTSSQQKPTNNKPTPTPTPSQLELATKSPKPSKAKPSSDHTEFVSAFTKLFKAANDGQSPTWGSRQGSTVKRLLKTHGLEACLSRASNMFTAPPSWPPGPYDLNSLSMHFDRFAVAQKQSSAGYASHTGRESYGTGKLKI